MRSFGSAQKRAPPFSPHPDDCRACGRATFVPPGLLNREFRLTYYRSGGVIAVKFGVGEQLVHSRFGPMTMAETSYRTARMAGADSYWVPDHLNTYCRGR